MKKLQILSDLHLDFPDNLVYLSKNPIIPSGDILICAGDCGHAYTVTKDFFKDLSPHYELIIVIPGNHCYYGKNKNDIVPFHDIDGNYHYLNNNVIYHGEYRFVCTTLWSPFEDHTRNSIADCSEIEGFSPLEARILFGQNRDWLKETLSQPWDGKTVVVSHHLPAKQCVNPFWETSGINSCFLGDCEDIIHANKIDCWFFGHSHSHYNELCGDTRLIDNPLGYVKYKENKCKINKFQHNLYVEI